MLRELRVKNLAVIESLTVPFGPGLNVLTGETGAGKSILIDALPSSSASAPSRPRRSGPAPRPPPSRRCSTLPGRARSPRCCRSTASRPRTATLVVRRELVRGGRGRVFLNDSNATLALLEQLGETLVEVHGQHEHQALLRPARHLDLLDAFAGLGILRDRLRQRHDEWRSVSAELDALRASARDQVARTAQYRETIAEIDAARLRSGEEEELRDERRRLMNAERLAEGANAAYRELYDDPPSAVERAGRAATLLRELARLDPAVQPTLQALDTALVQLDETARALRGYRDGVVFDPPRLEAIERRLDEIGRLKRKYGESVDAVLALRARLESDLEGLARAGEDEGRLAERVRAAAHRAGHARRGPGRAARAGRGPARDRGAGRARRARPRDRGVPGAPGAGAGRAAGSSAVGPEAWRLGPAGRRPGRVPLLGERRARTRGRSPASPRAASSRARCSPSRSSWRRPTRCRCWSSTRWTSGSAGKTADTVGKKLRQVAPGAPGPLRDAPAADRGLRRPALPRREARGRRAHGDDGGGPGRGATGCGRSPACSAASPSPTRASSHALELITQARGK